MPLVPLPAGGPRGGLRQTEPPVDCTYNMSSKTRLQTSDYSAAQHYKLTRFYAHKSERALLVQFRYKHHI